MTKPKPLPVLLDEQVFDEIDAEEIPKDIPEISWPDIEDLDEDERPQSR